MTSLLARFAENIYWLGRYTERAENMARILGVNETYARDSARGPDWQRVLDLYSDSERFHEQTEEATAEAVINFYVRDVGNPTSIRSSVAAARENARTVRHLISTEMWTGLNLFHNEVLTLKVNDTAVANLAGTASHIVNRLQTFTGIAEGTFQRGEPWCFYRLGKFIERADQTTRVLDINYDRLSLKDSDVVATVQWNAVLRSVSAYYAFRSRHPATSEPSDIAGFLLYDDEFPRAVTVCLKRATEMLRELEQRHGEDHTAALENERRKLEFALETGPGKELTTERLHELLDATQIALGRLSQEIARTYFAAD